MNVSSVNNNVQLYSGNAVNNKKLTAAAPVFSSQMSQNVDTVNFRSKKDIYIDKLNKLFPDGGIEKVYNDIIKDLGLENPPELKFVSDDDGVQAGGFTFSKNEISLSLSDILDSDYKIVGISGDKRTVVTSPSVQLPLFTNQKTAQMVVYSKSKSGNMGYEKLAAEPLTEDEQRQFIVQKISHELIHAQQHQIMCQTEGIGPIEVSKAWTHFKPKNLIEKYLFDMSAKKFHNKSYWGDKPEPDKIYSSDSAQGRLAKIWLEAVRNYPPVDSPDYVKNPIEVDAYTRSAQYAHDKYGAY